MFYRGYSILTALARSESIPAPHVPDALADWADSNAKRALTRDLRTLPLSQRDITAWLTSIASASWA